MTQSQTDFDKEETEIIECCKMLYGCKNKPDAIKKLIQIAGESESIKNTLKERKKINDKK